MNFPHLLVTDGNGRFIEVPDIYLAGVGFVKPVQPDTATLIPLPEDAELVGLPGRVAIGYDPELEKFVQLREYDGMTVYPVAAVLPAGQLQIYRSAFSMVLDAPRLPDKSYSAVGGRNGHYFTAALPLPQHPPVGPVLELEYLPVIDTAGVVRHLKQRADARVVLHCAGEAKASEVAEWIAAVRHQTTQGELQLAAPAATPEAVRDWCRAGLNRLHLTLNSAREAYYQTFYRPQGYRFELLTGALHTAASLGARIDLTYQTFPGLTDHPVEMKALEDLLREFPVEALHLTNLAIDPEWYMDELAILPLSRKQVGMANWLAHFQKQFPQTAFCSGVMQPEKVNPA